MNFPFLRAAKLFLAICLSLSFATTGHAAPKGKSKPKPPKIPYMSLASVDSKAMTITIESKNSTATISKTFKYTALTKVTVKGHDGTVSDLKPGMQVRVGTGADEGTAEQVTLSDPPADPK